MDIETAQAIDGAYAFTRSVMAAVLLDLLDEGASDARIERLLTRLDQAIESIPGDRNQQLASSQAAVLLASLRASAQQNRGSSEN